MLVTDVGGGSCWWQFSDDDDQFFTLKKSPTCFCPQLIITVTNTSSWSFEQTWSSTQSIFFFIDVEESHFLFVRTSYKLISALPRKSCFVNLNDFRNWYDLISFYRLIFLLNKMIIFDKLILRLPKWRKLLTLLWSQHSIWIISSPCQSISNDSFQAGFKLFFFIVVCIFDFLFIPQKFKKIFVNNLIKNMTD